jgi:NodT family efflux transporter outer membrane factor (OMF) lipoprotein
MPLRTLNRVAAGKLALACLLGVLAGCAAPVPRPATSFPAQWQQAMAADPAKPSDLQGWWHAFHDPQLDALVERALASNLDVAQADERLLATRAIRGRSGAKYLPSLVARTDDAIQPDAHASYFVAGFDATWEFGLFGRREGTRREAQGAMDASVADVRIARVSLVAEVVRNWIELRTAQQQEKLLSQISHAQLQNWKLLTIRQHLQLVAPAEVDRAQALSAQAQAALAEPRQAITASAQRLAVLVGQNHPDAAWLVPGAQPQLGDFTLVAAPVDLLRTRPEIARAQADVLSSAGELALTHADMFPSVGLGSSLVWAATINDTNSRSRTPGGIFSLGPLLNIPLFDWGMRIAATHAKGHELKAAVLAYQQAVLLGITDVQTALGALQQQHLREQQNTIAWQAMQRAEQAIQRRVQLRLDSPLDQIESELAVSQTAGQLIEARAEHSLAYVALFKALGGAPLPSPTALSSAAPEPSTPPARASNEALR